MTQKTKKIQKTDSDFIMSPKVDVCFAGLMENPIVRKGFCAAILRVPPETIEKTELLLTHLQRDHADDKLGILDVRVRMMDGVQINMEMQVKKYAFWDERTLFYLCKIFPAVRLDAPRSIQPTYPFAKTVLAHSFVC